MTTEEITTLSKQYISAETLLDASFKLGLKILDSNFKPNYIIGIWRGGTPVGIAVQELLDYFGVHSDHIAIRTSYYTGIDQRAKHVRVHGLNYIVKNCDAEDNLLIVDDVYDTGISIKAVIDHLTQDCRRNLPQDIRVATAYFKPNANKTSRVPDFYIYETDDWLVFPHEIQGLNQAEIAQKPGADALLERLKAAPK